MSRQIPAPPVTGDCLIESCQACKALSSFNENRGLQPAIACSSQARKRGFIRIEAIGKLEREILRHHLRQPSPQHSCLVLCGVEIVRSVLREVDTKVVPASLYGLVTCEKLLDCGHPDGTLRSVQEFLQPWIAMLALQNLCQSSHRVHRFIRG